MKKIHLNSTPKGGAISLGNCMPPITGEREHALRLAVLASRGRKTPNLSKGVKALFKKYDLLGYGRKQATSHKGNSLSDSLEMGIIQEIEEVNGAKIAVYTPQKGEALAEGLNLTTGFIMEKHAVDYGDAWDECWVKVRLATPEEKASILADLPKFQERELKDKIFHAAYLVANWGEDVNFALNEYGLPLNLEDEVLKVAGEIAENME